MMAKPSQILYYAFVSFQNSILKGTSKERDTISHYLPFLIQEIMIYKKTPTNKPQHNGEEIN